MTTCAFNWRSYKSQIVPMLIAERGQSAKGKRISNEVRSEIRDRLSSGERAADIARDLGISKSSISKMPKVQS